MSYSSGAVDCQTCARDTWPGAGAGLRGRRARRGRSAEDHSTCSKIQFVTHLYFIRFLFTLFPERFIVLKLDISFSRLDSLLCINANG